MFGDVANHDLNAVSLVSAFAFDALFVPPSSDLEYLTGLEREKIEHVFGIPGTQNLPLLDVLPTVLKSQGIPQPPGIAGRPLEASFDETGPERPAVFESKAETKAARVLYGARTSEATFSPGSPAPP